MTLSIKRSTQRVESPCSRHSSTRCPVGGPESANGATSSTSVFAARIHAEHKAIFRALELRDADGVRIRMAAHMLDTHDDVAPGREQNS